MPTIKGVGSETHRSVFILGLVGTGRGQHQEGFLFVVKRLLRAGTLLGTRDGDGMSTLTPPLARERGRRKGRGNVGDGEVAGERTGAEGSWGKANSELQICLGSRGVCRWVSGGVS